MAEKKILGSQTFGMSDQLKLSESYISLLLGIVVVIAVVVLSASFIKGKHLFTAPRKEISSQKTQNIAKSQPMTVSYVVQDGDDLKSIAQRFYGDADLYTQIAKDNHLENPDVVEVGTTLSLKNVKSEKAVAGVSTQMTQPGEKITGDTYTVKEGEILWDIAVRAYGDGYKFQDIINANNLPNPDNVPGGTVLKIPR